jgi:gliding motility-associated-like protein
VNKYLLVSFILLVFVNVTQSQTPTSCFEIESILVDACGTPEGENEMVRFHVGPTPLNTAALNVNWPNNGWLGICQSAATATKVAQLNASITACGLLLEPVGGVLPAGSTVILVSSTNFNTAANSFALLTDTLYIIFQCQGNTTGHFANATGSGTRTLSMNFGVGCSDVVTYDCQQLVDINGNTGLGGSSTDRDGATANFTWAGVDSYVNYGCTAPYVPQLVNAGPDLSACQGDTISLAGFASSSFGSVLWTGGAGTWINANQENASYIVSGLDNGNVQLILNATNCNGTVTDTMNLLVFNLPIINLSPSGIISICAGDTVTLSASGGGPYTWSTGVIGPSIEVFNPGTYTVSATSSCGTLTDTVIVTSGGAPVASINPNTNLVVCPGDSLQLNASGGVNYVWTNLQNTSSIYVSTPGVYGVLVSNGCGSDTISVNVAGSIAPLVNITNGTSLDICQGNTVTLEAVGIGNIDWLGVSTDSIITVGLSNTYTAIATNGCGTDSATIQINVNPYPTINLPATYSICEGNVATVTPVYVGNILWYDGSSAASQNITVGGNYFVSASNSCGADTAFFTVTVSSVTAGFTVDSLQGAAPLYVNFLNESVNGTSYVWDFGTGDTSNLTNPDYTFTQPGVYTVLLTSYNAVGCWDTTSAVINVAVCNNKVFIPNAFTPNLDEINNVFYVVSNCVLHSTVTIFNRWGQEVYSWTDLSQGWNGKTQQGAELPIGVYIYLFELNDVNGNNLTYRGTINLIR